MKKQKIEKVSVKDVMPVVTSIIYSTVTDCSYFVKKIKFEELNEIERNKVKYTFVIINHKMYLKMGSIIDIAVDYDFFENNPIFYLIDSMTEAREYWHKNSNLYKNYDADFLKEIEKRFIN